MRARTLVFGAVAATAGAAAAYALAVRPWSRSWGVDPEDAGLALPGDDLVANATVVETRGIEIGAPPEAVWPWLVQMGYNRAGWYSYDAIDMKGASLDRIDPALQHLAVGDLVPNSPDTAFEVKVVEPGQALVLYADEKLVESQVAAARAKKEAGEAVEATPANLQAAGKMMPSMPGFAASWAFVLQPLDGRRTRLVERLRVHVATPAGPAAAVMGGAFGFGVFTMVRKQMLGIRDRAEAALIAAGISAEFAAREGFGAGAMPAEAPAPEAPPVEPPPVEPPAAVPAEVTEAPEPATPEAVEPPAARTPSSRRPRRRTPPTPKPTATEGAESTEPEAPEPPATEGASPSLTAAEGRPTARRAVARRSPIRPGVRSRVRPWEAPARPGPRPRGPSRRRRARRGPRPGPARSRGPGRSSRFAGRVPGRPGRGGRRRGGDPPGRSPARSRGPPRGRAGRPPRAPRRRPAPRPACGGRHCRGRPPAPGEPCRGRRGRASGPARPSTSSARPPAAARASKSRTTPAMISPRSTCSRRSSRCPPSARLMVRRSSTIRESRRAWSRTVPRCSSSWG